MHTPQIIRSLLFIAPVLCLGAQESPITGQSVTENPVQFYGEAREQKDMVTLRKTAGEIRAQVASLMSERNIVKVLDNSDVRTEVLTKIAGYLGTSAEEKIALDAYAEALALPNANIASRYDIKRVFLYENEDALEKARKGTPEKYTEYDKSGNTLRMSWSTDDDKEHPDLPLVFIYKKAHLFSFDTQLKGWSKYYLKTVEQLIKSQYAEGAFSIVHHIVERWVNNDFPSLPRWYREGVIHAVSIYTLFELIGQSNSLQGYAIDYPRYNNSRNYELAEVYAWDVKADETNHSRFVRTVTETILEGDKHGKTGSLGLVMKSLRAEDQSAPITSEAIFARYSTVAGVDMKKILLGCLPRKNI